MSAKFSVDLRGDVVIVTHVGRLEYAETNNSLAAAAQAAVKARTKLVLFDLTKADLANYYSYSIRHAEHAQELGLDTTYKVAFVGLPECLDVLEFTERVTRNRGWQSRHFFDVDDAVQWLHSGGQASTTSISSE